MSKDSKLAEIAKSLNNFEEKYLEDEFLALVNIQPPASLIKQNNGIDYLPIEAVEMLLTKVFQRWRVEIRDSKNILNAVLVVVRVHYMHPVTNEWEWQDGIGAQKIQVDKGSAASNLQNIKPDAISMAGPSAKSLAIKDAAHHIGKLFGKDLNRSGAMDFKGTYATDELKQERELKKLELRESNDTTTSPTK